jgi:cytosine permease
MPEWLSTIFWGLVMTFTVMYGFQALKFLNYIMAPVLLLILAYTLYSVLSSGGLTVLSAYRPASSMSLTTGMSLTVGSFAMGAFTTGDFCRYTKNPGGLILSLFIGIVIVGPVVILSGAVFRIAAGNGDITALLTGLGFPAGALIILIFATWTSNVVNAYSGSIAVSVLLGLEEKRFKLTAAITGSVGTILGAAGIFTRFLDFLSLLSSLVPPVAGVIIAAYLVRIIRNKRRENSGDQPNPPENNPGIHISHSGYGAGVLSFPPGFHLPGLAAYGLGALAAWFTGAMVPFFIPSVNGIIVAMAAYMVLEKIFIRRAGSKIAKSPWGARD